uniref:Uncharacterized protein n=1 Tax=Vitis vinifera TaxID=29760 RepID=A5AW32_VITVI|nr:hypothetical protein VITISV_026345 [Vitis vinifera]
MDVSLESKSLPSVGNSRKSYLKVTSQRLARGKLVHLLGWRSLALPSVGRGDSKQISGSTTDHFARENGVCEISQTLKRGYEITSQQKGYSRRAAKLASILRFPDSSLRHISGNFRRKYTTLYKKAAKSLRNKRKYDIRHHRSSAYMPQTNGVKLRPFQKGDLVLRILRGLVGDPRRKFRPSWSGPYVVRELTPEGAAWLTDLDANQFSNLPMWVS